jgi:hypothetical protein
MFCFTKWAVEAAMVSASEADFADAALAATMQAAMKSERNMYSSLEMCLYPNLGPDLSQI